MKSHQNLRAMAAVTAAGVAAVVAARPAAASLAVDLRFANGFTTMSIGPADAGRDVPIYVYATVTGANPVTQQTVNGQTTTDATPAATTGNFDGVQYLYYSVLSGGRGTAGVMSGNLDTAPGFGPTLNPTLGFNSRYGTQVGSVSDANGDGIYDLGATGNMTDLAKPRSDYAVFNNFTTDTGQKDAGGHELYTHVGAPDVIVSGATRNTVSFLVETIYFKVGTGVVAGQGVTFTAQIPPLTTPYSPANWFEDNTVLYPFPTPPQSTANGTQSGTFAAGTSVAFVGTAAPVPEPVTAAAVLVAAASLVARRRRP